MAKIYRVKRKLHEDTNEDDIIDFDEPVSQEEDNSNVEDSSTEVDNDYSVVGNADEQKSAMFNIVKSVLVDTFNNIDNLSSIITTLNNGSFEDLDDSEDIIIILNSIIDDNSIHIGMLQKALSLIDRERWETIEKGEEKADDIIDSKEEDEDDYEEDDTEPEYVDADYEEEDNEEDNDSDTLELVDDEDDDIDTDTEDDEEEKKESFNRFRNRRIVEYRNRRRR